MIFHIKTRNLALPLLNNAVHKVEGEEKRREAKGLEWNQSDMVFDVGNGDNKASLENTGEAITSARKYPCHCLPSSGSRLQTVRLAL